MSLLIKPQPLTGEFDRLFGRMFDAPVAQRWVPAMDLVELRGEEQDRRAELPGTLPPLDPSRALPPQIAGVSYARGCRIRRVRVPSGPDGKKARGNQTVILSRRALKQAKKDDAAAKRTSKKATKTAKNASKRSGD